jgi:hypothetical protein
MAELLPENVTLADLVVDKRLSKPQRYLRKALGNLLFFGEHGVAALRIGRTGNGTWPQYVLENTEDGKMRRFGGQSHTEWADDPAHHEERWSQAVMTGPQLHALWQKVMSDA